MTGQWYSKPSLAIPADIRSAYPLYKKAPHHNWDREELKGLMYLHSDKGPMEAWLDRIGRAETPACVCGEAQNAAHLLESGCVGEAGKKWEDRCTDRVFCAEVMRFL